MFDIVDTAFSHERELILSSFLQDYSKRREINLHFFCNAHAAFLLDGEEALWHMKGSDTDVIW